MEKKKIIDVESVTKKFKNFTAVDGVSFFVNEGETFAFLGPNGAGKTTTIKMLTTLLHPTSGNIKINGFSTVNQKDKVRCSFGIVFQDPSLDDDLTALENMEFHAEMYDVKKSLRKKRIFELMNLVELWDRRKDYVKTFSGGMKRRLEIARGLIHHPKIFFLDEPTIGLDPQTRNFMWKYIKKMSKSEGTTIFLTTHYIEEAEKVADRVAIIDNGKIIQIGTPNELKKSTKSESLEEAFLKLTGHSIREESASAKDRMRLRGRAWGRR